MAEISTKQFKLPREIVQEVVTKAHDTSVIQTLSPSSPRIFADTSHVVFSEDPEGEFVDESANHSASNTGIKPVDGIIKKVHVTVRMSNEVVWADEDAKVLILDALTEAGGVALGRALDYGVFHAVNPLSGAALSGATALTAGAQSMVKTEDAAADLDSLIELIGDGYDVNGIGLAKAYASSLRKLRADGSGMRLYPDIPVNLKPASIDGVAAVTSSTVPGIRATDPTHVLAIAGDYNMIKWGIVRDLGLEVIPYGNPDGLGDLKQKGQIAYRMEMVYSWAVLDPKAFAVLKSE